MYNPLDKNNIVTPEPDAAIAEMITSVEALNTLLELLPKSFEKLSAESQLAFFQHKAVAKFFLKAYTMNCVGAVILDEHVMDPDKDVACQCDACVEASELDTE